MGKFDYKLKDKKRLVSVFITLIVVFVLVFSGPVGALDPGIEAKESGGPGIQLFYVWVDIKNIDPGERVPIKFLGLYIYKDDVLYDYVSFYPNGNKEGGGENFLIFLDDPIVGESYGPRYGYSTDRSTLYDFGYGYGFGYEEGREGKQNAELRYHIEWDKIKANATEGQYLAIFQVTARGGSSENIHWDSSTDFEII